MLGLFYSSAQLAAVSPIEGISYHKMALGTEYIPPDHLATDSGKTFDTYRYYLECICEHLLLEYQTWSEFAEKVASTTLRIQGVQGLDIGWIRQYLKIAWNTEFLVQISDPDPDITRISNQWLPVQVYYSVYSAAEAVAYAMDSSKSVGHQKTLRKVSSLFLNLGLSPWDKAFQGRLGRSGSSHKQVNFPAGMVLPHNLKRGGVDPLAMLGTCLKAEHKKRRNDGWKSKRETKVYKYQYDPGTTTVLHFLYRLRIKCNYKDIDPFLSEAPIHHVLAFAECLRHICSWSVTLMEIYLMRKCRKRTIIDIAKEYLTSNSRALTLKKRVNEYSSII